MHGCGVYVAEIGRGGRRSQHIRMSDHIKVFTSVIFETGLVEVVGRICAFVANFLLQVTFVESA